MTGDQTSQDQSPTLPSGAIRRSTLAGTVLTRLREQILSGRLASGTALPTEREIGEAFGVGRTTVREALRGLEVAGFVHRRAKKLIVNDAQQVPENEVDYGAFAVRASIQEVFATRRLLEVEGARLAATHHTAEDLAVLHDIVSAMEPGDPETYQTLSMEFHTHVIVAGGNPVLAQVYHSARHLLFKRPAFWRVFGRPGQQPIGRGPLGHEEILRAIASGDGEEAARITLEHLNFTAHALMERVRTSDSAVASVRPAP
ncbi:FadR/GntR family transcriptional regulator [Streptomyces sp. NPDC058220]|uniref:FadR/GntR family transcriptional regulator n=1 Tax=unclassified Streptomyces TaxID=2593676 RepID=UPI003651BFFE